MADKGAVFMPYKGTYTILEGELAELVHEVAGEPDTYMGPAGAERGLQLFSRLAESGWFERAHAALTNYKLPKRERQ
jgi:hypothetical protein